MTANPKGSIKDVIWQGKLLKVCYCGATALNERCWYCFRCGTKINLQARQKFLQRILWDDLIWHSVLLFGGLFFGYLLASYLFFSMPEDSELWSIVLICAALAVACMFMREWCDYRKFLKKEEEERKYSEFSYKKMVKDGERWRKREAEDKKRAAELEEESRKYKKEEEEGYKEWIGSVLVQMADQQDINMPSDVEMTKAEKEIVDILKQFFQPSQIFANTYVKKAQVSSHFGSSHTQSDVFTEIDIIVVIEQGILVIESKGFGGVVSGAVKDKSWFREPYGNKKAFSFANPIKQNEMHIQSLDQHLTAYFRHCLLMYYCGAVSEEMIRRMYDQSLGEHLDEYFKQLDDEHSERVPKYFIDEPTSERVPKVNLTDEHNPFTSLIVFNNDINFKEPLYPPDNCYILSLRRLPDAIRELTERPQVFTTSQVAKIYSALCTLQAKTTPDLRATHEKHVEKASGKERVWL